MSKPQTHTSNVNFLLSQLRFMRLASACLLICLFVLTGALLRIAGKSTRVILTPAQIRQEFWVEEDRVAPAYLEEWSYFLLSLFLSIGPETSEYQHNTILKYTDESLRDRLAAQFSRARNRIAANRTATRFAVTNVILRENHNQIAFSGNLTTYVGGQKISEKFQWWLMTYRVVNDRLWLVGLSQTDANDPFAEQQPEEQANQEQSE